MRQTEVYIRYWGTCNKQVKVRYSRNQFLGHATSNFGATSFNKSIESLN